MCGTAIHDDSMIVIDTIAVENEVADNFMATGSKIAYNTDMKGCVR